ncbi:MAG: hypothetical protein K2Z81_12305, partial [Cyanobacteria bacterium]|nr:hypothetical protein [Cyanobacteriota bacterium]
MMGTAKTNFGHTETAAGVLGVLKALLCIEHGALSRHLHLSDLNGFIGVPLMEKINAVVPLEHVIVPKSFFSCGVSSFGFSGTNAHVILSSPFEREMDSFSGENTFACFTARSMESLRSLISKFGLGMKDLPFSVTLPYVKSFWRGRAKLPFRCTFQVVEGKLRPLVDGGKISPSFSQAAFCVSECWRVGSSVRQMLRRFWKVDSKELLDLLVEKKPLADRFGFVTPFGSVVVGLSVARAIQGWGVDFAFSFGGVGRMMVDRKMRYAEVQQNFGPSNWVEFPEGFSGLVIESGRDCRCRSSFSRKVPLVHATGQARGLWKPDPVTLVLSAFVMSGKFDHIDWAGKDKVVPAPFTTVFENEPFWVVPTITEVRTASELFSISWTLAVKPKKVKGARQTVVLGGNASFRNQIASKLKHFTTLSEAKESVNVVWLAFPSDRAASPWQKASELVQLVQVLARVRVGRL